jgi:hypothetical protein
MEEFKNEECVSATVNTLEDSQKLIEAEFEFVTDLDGVELFRKRK